MNAAISLNRVSTDKQAYEGESLEVQGNKNSSKAARTGYKIVKVFFEPYSGRKDYRPVLEEIYKYISSHPEITALFITDIDRLTRQGAPVYNQIKEKFKSLGIRVIDTLGIIQEDKNTLEDVGFTYDWSLRSPSRLAENIKADIANEEVTTILTRLIGQEIRLTQKGYVTRPANIGYQNAKIYDENGKKRTICLPHPIESKWLITMFKEAAKGVLTDKEICDKVNAMGFKTRVLNVKDLITRKIIGKRGGRKLIPKMLQTYLQNPIYCGIIMGKWTNYKPVKAQFKGLVSVDVFNKANKGKIGFQEMTDGSFQVIKKEIVRKSKENPEYPFRHVVTCSKCGNALSGSASTGRKGKRYPAYHCNKGHYFRVPKDKFHKSIEKFVEQLSFNPNVIDALKEIVKEIAGSKQYERKEEKKLQELSIANLKQQQKVILDKIMTCNSELVIKKLEAEIEHLQQEIESTGKIQLKGKLSSKKIDQFHVRLKNILEHPEKALLSTVNSTFTKEAWRLFFESKPKYEKICFGTAELSLPVRLCSMPKRGENRMACQVRKNWHQIVDFINHIVNLPDEFFKS